MRTCIAIIMLAFAMTAVAAESGHFTNQCPGNKYCRNIGKHAYNATGQAVMRGIDLGPIIGVTYKSVGEEISAPQDSAVRTSRHGGYYYIIGPGAVSTYPFLRSVREIKAKKH